MNYKKQGEELRVKMKELVLEFMKSKEECAVNSIGMHQAEIFRECGLDWGDQKCAKSDNQQYYVNALIRVLESEGKVQRDEITKKWRLK